MPCGCLVLWESCVCLGLSCVGLALTCRCCLVSWLSCGCLGGCLVSGVVVVLPCFYLEDDCAFESFDEIPTVGVVIVLTNYRLQFVQLYITGHILCSYICIKDNHGYAKRHRTEKTSRPSGGLSFLSPFESMTSLYLRLGGKPSIGQNYCHRQRVCIEIF